MRRSLADLAAFLALTIAIPVVTELTLRTSASRRRSSNPHPAPMEPR